MRRQPPCNLAQGHVHAGIVVSEVKGRLSLPSATFGLQEAMPEVAKNMPASEKDMKPIAGQPRPSFAFNSSARPFKPLLQSSMESYSAPAKPLNPNAAPFRPMLTELAEVLAGQPALPA